MDRDPITVRAPAKINLFLGVGDARADGFHDVTTIMHALEFGDEVWIEAADELKLESLPAEPCAPEDNLAFRAARRFAEALGRTPGARIAIRKRVPAGAGLGGGSSDAAAALVGLARLWEVEPGDPRLEAIARDLGSDVPFFLQGGAAQWGGRGEVLERVFPAADVAVALLMAAAPLSTVAVYRGFDSSPQPVGDATAVADALAAGSSAALGAALANNLTEAACGIEPRIETALRWARERDGVLGAAMTGSGAAVFAICGSDEAARAFAADAASRGWWSAATRTAAQGAEVFE